MAAKANGVRRIVTALMSPKKVGAALAGAS
jgi:hypothetical protein